MKDYPKTTAIGGLAFPAYKHSGGYFVRKNKWDVAWGDILIALFTRPNSKVHRREFGCRLTDLLFAPTNTIELQTIKYLVSETIKKFADHITIVDVTLNRIAKGIEIGITFTLTADKGEPQSRTVTIPKTFITNG
jgi:uncharacterized protein